jgi:hypothetical protein
VLILCPEYLFLLAYRGRGCNFFGMTINGGRWGHRTASASTARSRTARPTWLLAAGLQGQEYAFDATACRCASQCSSSWGEPLRWCIVNVDEY